jgi:membrane protease YdiL (CAAX protease family)
MEKNSGTNHLIKNYNRLPLIIRAILSGFVVSTTGIAIWTVLLLKISPPWSILPMIAVLWIFVKYYSGNWGSLKSKESGRQLFRRVHLSSKIWKWGITAAIFFVVIVQASFVITFRLTEFPVAQFTADYKVLDKMPLWAAWAILIASSIVAGICEETGYRGYLQVPLEKKYGPSTAIVVCSLVFTLIHLGKTWAYPILPHIFFASVLLGILAFKSGSLIPGIIGHSILDIFNYSFWWSGITGGFRKHTIFKTGIDVDFIVWILVILIALFIFFKAVARLKYENWLGDQAYD